MTAEGDGTLGFTGSAVGLVVGATLTILMLEPWENADLNTSHYERPRVPSLLYLGKAGLQWGSPSLRVLPERSLDGTWGYQVRMPLLGGAL